MFGRIRWPRKFWPRVGVFGLALLLACVCGNEWAIRSTQARLDAQIESERAQGHPASVDEVLGQPLAPDDDASVPLRAAGRIAIRLASTIAGAAGTGDLSDPTNMYIGPAIDAAIGARPDYDAELARADELPRYRCPADVRPPYISVRLRHLDDFRAVSRMEAARGRRLAEKGERDAAVRILLRHLRLIRKFEANEPFLMCSVAACESRNAMIKELHRILRLGPLPAECDSLLTQELERHETARHCLLQGLSGEKVMSREYYWEGLESYGAPWINNWIFRAAANVDREKLWSTIREQIDLLDMPYSEAVAAESRFRRQFGGSPSISGLPINGIRFAGTRLLAPNMMKARREAEASVALVRCLRIVYAFERRAGAKTLSDLGLTEDRTRDPFDGGALRVCWRPEGVVVYSVGFNLVDDGGEVDSASPTDIGLAPKAKQK
jgi:hypothetical protein